MTSLATAQKARLSWLIATCFVIGPLQPGSGTWASAVTIALWWAARIWLPSAWLVPVAIAVSALVALIGIPPSTVVARESGIEDPGLVVIDEVAGQMIALIAVPVNWKYMLAGFILFRSFDIVKPFPLRRPETVPGWEGVLMVDGGAGLFRVSLAQHMLELF